MSRLAFVETESQQKQSHLAPSLRNLSEAIAELARVTGGHSQSIDVRQRNGRS
jgi:hypothetical protein